MRLAVVQTNPVFGEVEANVRTTIEMMENVPADCFVLPELCNTGYNFIDKDEAFDLAETTSGPTFRAFCEFAKRKSCYVVYGFAEKANELYNSAALVGPSGFIGLYRKIHLFNREKLYFAVGNLGFPVYDLPFGKVGIMICFDWIYPEAARSLALKGAQLIVHPSNLVTPYCPDAMVTRCLENRVFTATADRVGRENRGGIDLTYIGRSEIITPRGEILTRLSNDEVGVGVAEVDLSEAVNKKFNEFNDLLIDRKIDHYSR